MWPLLVFWLATAVLADNDFTFTGTPVAGQPFTITWTPGSYSKVDIMLNNLLDSGPPIVTTSAAIASQWPIQSCLKTIELYIHQN